MELCGATAQSPREFYWEVNRAYHTAEAPVYEQLHLDMVRELPDKWSRLASTLARGPRSLRWLDVGCGTGLVGSILHGLIGHRICEAVLLDPSPQMVAQCKPRAGLWGFRTHLVVGTIDTLAARPTFDLITVSSVLHHVVELDRFCQDVSRMLRPGGYLITCQDPRSTSSSDLVLKIRTVLARYPDRIHALRYRTIGRLPRAYGLGRLVRRLRPRREPTILPRSTHVSQPPSEERVGVGDLVIRMTNDELLRKKVVGRTLSPQEVWAVTDFHLPGQPGQFGAGIDLGFLARHLDPLHLDEYFTYDFFGYVGQPIPPRLAAAEDALFQRSDRHGVQFASRWRKS